MPPLLTRRELGRATLARQLLLRRHAIDPLTTIDKVAGLNAQLVPTAYLSLAARLDHFEPSALVQLLRAKRVARANLMRGTIHLLSTTDYLSWQPALQPALERTFRAFNAGRWRDIDPTAVRSAARKFLASGSPTRTELTRHLQDLGGDAAMFFARVVLPLVQLPPAGEWGNAASPRYGWAADWFGRELDPSTTALDNLILRYLGAFGPATVKDIQYWSGLTGLAAHCRRLAAQLATFEDEDGKLLYDLPNAPRPNGRIAAPPRLLPEFDNLVFAHADRSRIVPTEHRKMLNPRGGQFRPPLLIDGIVAGIWRWDRSNDVLVLSPFEQIPSRYHEHLLTEAKRTAAFLSPSARITTHPQL